MVRSNSSLTIGVLALQGDFKKHAQMIHQLGGKIKEVRKSDDLKNCDSLIIPGGESTTLSKLIDQYELREPILEFAKTKPIMGTCAGAILLSKNANDKKVKPLGLMDIKIQRNAYGRQIDSFSASIQIKGFTSDYEGIFIRAPQIVSLPLDKGGLRGICIGAEVLSTHNNHPIMVQQNNILAITFHPELTNDLRVHEYFLGMNKL